MLDLKTVIYQSKLLDFQIFASLVFDVFCKRRKNYRGFLTAPYGRFIRNERVNLGRSLIRKKADIEMTGWCFGVCHITMCAPASLSGFSGVLGLWMTS